MYEFHDPEGPCAICGGSGVINISGIDFCIDHFAEEMSLTEKEATEYLQFIGIRIQPLSPLPVQPLPPLGKATDVAELGM